MSKVTTNHLLKLRGESGVIYIQTVNDKFPKRYTLQHVSMLFKTIRVKDNEGITFKFKAKEINLLYLIPEFLLKDTAINLKMNKHYNRACFIDSKKGLFLFNGIHLFIHDFGIYKDVPIHISSIEHPEKYKIIEII